MTGVQTCALPIYSSRAEWPAPAEGVVRSERIEGSPWGEPVPRARSARNVDRSIPPAFGRYRIEVGSEHGVQPKNIVGALCNEAALDGKQILNLDIHGIYSLVDLPYPFSASTFRRLQKVKISGQEIQIKLIAKAEADLPPGLRPRVRKAAPDAGRPAQRGKKPF